MGEAQTYSEFFQPYYEFSQFGHLALSKIIYRQIFAAYRNLREQLDYQQVRYQVLEPYH